MAGIFSDVTTDIQKLRQLKAEIENVKKALKSIDVNVNIDIAKGMEAQLQSLTRQYDALVKKISEAEGKIMISTKRINDASEKIIKAQEQLSKAAGMNAQSSNVNANAPANQTETASVQAQAKAYDELAAEIDDVLGTRTQNIKRMIEEQRAIDLIKKEIKELTKYQTENSTLSATRQRRLEQLNNSLLTHKAALSEVKQTLMNNAKLDNAASTSMNGLSQSLSRMRITYRELTEEERNSPFGKELLASINQADAKIKELDATIGNHQRNVGNYAKAYNGLNVSVQQIVRELPSAAMGLNMFFLAISNNLPILTDEIKRAKDRNAELIAQNQKATPVWKQLVSSIFSWQSAMMVGITLLTVYGKDIWEWIRGLSKAKEAIIDMISAEQEMAMARKKASESIKKEQAELDMLYRIMKNSSNTMEQRKSAYADFVSLYPKYANVMDNEKINIGKLNTAYKELTKSIKERAVAESYMNTISELSVKRENEEIKRLNQKLTVSKAEERYRKAQEDYNKIKSAGFAFSEETIFFEILQKERQNVEVQKKIYNDIVKNVENYTSKIEAIEEHTEKLIAGNKETPKEGTLAYLEQEKDILDAQLKSLTEIEAKGEKGIELRKKIADLDKRMEVFNVSSRSSTTDKGSKVLARNEQSFSQDLQKQAEAAEQATTDAVNEMTRTMLDGLDDEQEAMYKYLRNYGTFREQQRAITEEYARKIADAGGADTWQGKLLGKERDQALSDLYVKSAETASAISRLFGDMKDKTLGELQDINLKGSEALEFLKSGEWDKEKGAMFGITKEQFDTLKQSPEALEAISNALNDNRQAADRLRPAYGKVEDGLKKMFDAGDDSKKLKEALSDICDGLNEIIRLGSFASDVFSNMGDAFGSDVLKGVSDGINAAMDAVNATLTGAQAGSMFGQMFGPMGSIVGGAVGFATSLAGSIAGMLGADYSDYEEMKSRYDTLVSVWDTLIDKKTEYIDIDYGVEAQKAADEAARLVGVQIQRQRQLAQMLAGSGASAGSHSLGYRVNDRMSSSDWRSLSALVGQRVGSLQDVLNLDADVIGKVLQDEHFVSVLTTVNSDFIEYIQNIGEYGEQLEEIAEKEREAVTGIGFDAFKDGYLDMLSDLESTNEDFADDFEKNLQNAIFSALVANKYSDRIKSLYEDWAKAGEDGLTSREAEELRREQQQIVEDMLADREQLMEDFGWSSSSEQQSASGRGFGTEMTHEDAGELSGRFTAVYESNLRIEAAEQQQTVAITELRGSISALTAQASGMYNIADETRNILANSYLELQQIRENTGEIIEPIKKMQKDISEVKKNTAKL